jgi:hypothetical protein
MRRLRDALRRPRAAEIKGAPTQATGTTLAAQSRTSKPKTTNLVARHAAGLVLRRHLLLLLQLASLACPATSGSNNPTQHTCIACPHLQQLAQGCTRISRNHKRMRRGGGGGAREKGKGKTLFFSTSHSLVFQSKLTHCYRGPKILAVKLWHVPKEKEHMCSFDLLLIAVAFCAANSLRMGYHFFADKWVERIVLQAGDAKQIALTSKGQQQTC